MTMVDMVLEALREADNPKGVSVMAIKKRVLERHPLLQEARLKASLKKAFESALAAGTIVRVRGQAEAGSSLSGSFRIAAAKKTATAGARSEKASTARGPPKTAKAPAIQVNGATKRAADGSRARKPKAGSKSSLKKSASDPEEDAAAAGDNLSPVGVGSARSPRSGRAASVSPAALAAAADSRRAKPAPRPSKTSQKPSAAADGAQARPSKQATSRRPASATKKPPRTTPKKLLKMPAGLTAVEVAAVEAAIARLPQETAPRPKPASARTAATKAKAAPTAKRPRAPAAGVE